LQSSPEMSSSVRFQLKAEFAESDPTLPMLPAHAVIATKPKSFTRGRLLGAASVSVLALAALAGSNLADAVRGETHALGFSGATATQERSVAPLTSIELALPTYEEVNRGAVDEVPVLVDEWTRVRVRAGQTLGAIFKNQGLGSSVMHSVLAASDSAKKLTQLRVGQELRFRIVEQKLATVEFDLDEQNVLRIDRNGDEYTAERIKQEFEYRVRDAAGTIRSSLYRDAGHAGLSDALIADMIELFAFDIDFALDLAPGDRFAVIYDQAYRNGERVRDGKILAASFTNRGKTYELFRMEREDGSSGYFTRAGGSLKKGFIRTPVAVSRISSGFGMRRHPILGTMRAHKGVDYAAPTGTPIKATADGTITFRGWQNGYGNTIEIKHFNGYTTLYGHMSRFSEEMSKGDSISQGDVIGYVGSTGMSNGPHLHYEFRVNGLHVDPLTVDLPRAEPLRGSDLARFKAQNDEYLARMQLVARGTVASVE
jgi:murein DD-endopeptidase MepM/ murein hydrolase activator NlpD